MHTRVVKPRNGPALIVRPLRHGDVATVLAVFGRLGERSRRARFNGPKPCLSPAELEQLAAVDSNHHALVGYVEGDPQPVAVAQLVRTGRDSAEIAFAVADDYQQRGIGSALGQSLGAVFSRIKAKLISFPRVQESSSFLNEFVCELAEYDELMRIESELLEAC